MKKALIAKERQLFSKFGIVHYPEVIVRCFDPYSLAPDRDKIYLHLKDATLKLTSEGEVTLLSLKRKIFISEDKAKIYIKGVSGKIPKIPFHSLEFSHIYDTKLEAELMHKPVIAIPENIDAEGGIIPYNTSIIESLICDAIVKFTANQQGTENEIIDALTLPYPEGGGWYSRTPLLIQEIKHTLKLMVNRGSLDYDEQTQNYSYISKSSSTRIRR
jgi:hypothetical protein